MLKKIFPFCIILILLGTAHSKKWEEEYIQNIQTFLNVREDSTLSLTEKKVKMISLNKERKKNISSKLDKHNYKEKLTSLLSSPDNELKKYISKILSSDLEKDINVIFKDKSEREQFNAEINNTSISDDYKFICIKHYFKNLYRDNIQDELSSGLQNLIDATSQHSFDSKLKGYIIYKLGEHPNLNSPDVFFNHLYSKNDTLKKYSMKGLEKYIRYNNVETSSDEILDRLSQNFDKDDIEKGKIICLAKLNYYRANDFLIEQLEDNVDGLTLIAFAQPELQDEKLLLKLIDKYKKFSSKRSKIAVAIRTGYPNLESFIQTYLDGNKIIEGLTLIQISPDLAPKFENVILQLATAGGSQKNLLALNLIRHLSNGKELMQNYWENAKNEKDRELLSAGFNFKHVEVK